MNTVRGAAECAAAIRQARAQGNGVGAAAAAVVAQGRVEGSDPAEAGEQAGAAQPECAPCPRVVEQSLTSWAT